MPTSLAFRSKKGQQLWFKMKKCKIPQPCYTEGLTLTRLPWLPVLHKKNQGNWMLLHCLLYHSTFVATHNAAISGCKMSSFRESFLQRGLYWHSRFIKVVGNHQGQDHSTKQNVKQIHVRDAKRGKACAQKNAVRASHNWLLLIGWQNGARFLKQSLHLDSRVLSLITQCNNVKPNQARLLSTLK